MRRLSFAAFALLLSSGAIRAQDMPLSQILIDGEGWKKVEGEKPKVRDGIGHAASPPHGWRWNTQPKNSAVYFGFPGDPRQPDRFPVPLKHPTGLTFSPDGGTLYVADAGSNYIWAFRMNRTNARAPEVGAPYCPLRLPPGKEASEAAGLATDKDGRIYAATPLGVQVFDPTGRLCGVMNGTPTGRMHTLQFEDDLLVCWTDEGKYTRKLNTAGPK